MKYYKESSRKKFLHTPKRKTTNWIGHILLRNWLLKHVIEGNIEVTMKGGRRRKQILDDLK